MAEETFSPARVINLVLGAWLFVSAFLWPHTQAEFTNAWLVGLGVVVFALAAFWAPPARWVNTALGAWLIVSVWVLPTTLLGTFWNNLLVGIAVFLVSFYRAAPTQPHAPGWREREAHP